MDVFVREDDPVHLWCQCLPINHLLQTCVYVCVLYVCVRVIFQDGWSVCAALTANQSTSVQLTCWEAEYLPIPSHKHAHRRTFELLKHDENHATICYRLQITTSFLNFTMDAMETRTFRPSVLNGFPAIAMATDWLMGGTFSRSSSDMPILFFPPRVSETTETNRGQTLC